jgi:hypothetical protein
MLVACAHWYRLTAPHLSGLAGRELLGAADAVMAVGLTQ